jgi:receptor expression-enhancing protein 5/6
VSWEERLHAVNASLSDLAAVRWTAEKLGVQPWVVAGLGSCWIIGFLLWGFTGELVCTVIGLLYPTYASFKALEDEHHDEVFRWLRYWTTYSAMALSENVFYRVLAWVPFYHILRILVVLWLFLPSFQGADSVYTWVVGPVLRRYSPKIDAALARSAEEVRGTLGAAAGVANTAEIRSMLRRAAASGAGYVANDLGVEDLMVQELSKAASNRLSQGASRRSPAPMESPAPGARARVASPAPRYSPGNPPAAADSAAEKMSVHGHERTNKENVAY